MDTWPISMQRQGQHVFLGIPPRLGDGTPGGRADWPTLEQRAGEDWLEQVLAVALPSNRTWLWWTQNSVLKQSKLRTERAPSRIHPARVDRVLRRNLWLRQLSLIAIPATDQTAQRSARSWAGADTEQVPDHFWTAPDAAPAWDLEEIARWFGTPSCRRDRVQVSTRPAERVLTLYGGYLFCCLPLEAGAVLRAELNVLAGRWGLKVIDGAEQDAWAE